MGAILNIKASLFNGVLAQVPFVDVLTTMLDDTIPLTTGEYNEWGNPNDKKVYDYILSYSPYDNVSKKNYPHIMITTSIHDNLVQYFEPAKWVAKLRELKTDKNLLLFNIDMNSGHVGSFGRFERLRKRAKEFNFFISIENNLF